MGKSRREVIAAGAVVWRVKGRKLEVLLIHRPRYDDWSWPKGKLDGPDESLPMCAVREVREETGVPVLLGVKLPTVRYKINGSTLKVCHYWAATPVDPDGPAAGALAARGKIKDCSKHEVDQVRWVEARKAAKLLTRSADKEPLGALMDLWEDDILRTWTLLVVRHGRAKKRSAWKDGESTRPLTPAGRKQSANLVPLLAAFGVQEVISSPWERCVATVRPYAEASDNEVLLAPEITESAAKKRPGGVRALVDDLLGKSREVTAVCTHRPVLPFVLEAVTKRSPHRVTKYLPKGNPYLRTAEVLVIHMARRQHRRARVVSVELHRAPS